MRKLHPLVGAVLCTAIFAGASFAFQSQSSSYVAQPQAITSGSEASSSASYLAPQQALGPLAGPLSNATYSTNVGAVQAVPSAPEPTSVDDWRELDR